MDVTAETVRAAGGLVCRSSKDGDLEVVVVHRPAYDDWTFPKGKLQEGEIEEDAALREVEEETGLRCVLEHELTTISYRDGHGRPKTARYWVMTPVAGVLGASNEVDDARWVRLGEAAELLTYPRDLALLDALRT